MSGDEPLACVVYLPPPSPLRRSIGDKNPWKGWTKRSRSCESKESCRRADRGPRWGLGGGRNVGEEWHTRSYLCNLGMHRVPAAQYESASLRKFVGGRTETIRSCSEESVRFACAMLNTTISDQSKANALRVAVNTHKDYTVAALNGLGVDRHLLGLKLLAKENNLEIPKLYSDIAFTRSSTMRMSTSQVASQCDAFMNYGPLVNDGYGCCYNPRKSNINFGTSSFVSCKETSAAKLHEALEASLCEMIDVLRKSPQSKL